MTRKKSQARAAGRNQRELPPSPSAPRRSRARRRGFAVVVLLFPLLFFALVEAGLRLGGYGRSYPLFIANEYHPEFALANPKLIKRYFPDPTAAPRVSIDIGFFRSRKAAGSVRIFVQGGSTAAGFPFGPGASLAGMLQQRLRRDFPEREIEVISTAMSAVNSYTLLDLSAEIIERQPDAVLVYAGHNEYLGVLGVGSVFGGGLARPLTRAYLWLSDWRTFQLLQDIVTGARGLFRGESREHDGATLMAQLAGSREIPFRSALYDAGVAQFEGNLDRLLARYRALGIPVFVGTLVSNERDQPPFVGGPAPGSDGAGWQARYRAGSEALARGDGAAAAAALQAAIAVDDGAADAHYATARLLEANGEFAAARQAYLAAKDRDRLRFRAPETFNDVIRATAKRYGATVVEVQRAFVAASPNGLVGDGLMLEHLHPTLDGYFLLADAFYQAMREQRLIDSWQPAVSAAEARADLPVTEVERLRGLYTVQKLKANWPFRDEPSKFALPPPRHLVEALAQRLYQRQIPWVVAMQQLFGHYRDNGDTIRALGVALSLADALPYLENPQSVAGRMLVDRGRHRQALRYLKRAVELAPDKLENLLALARAFILGDREAEAERVLARLLQLDPNHAAARRLMTRIE